MKQAICDQAKMEFRNKPWLDQPSEHHKVVITVLIHTWNEHKDIQVNKLTSTRQDTCMLNTQPMHITQDICI